MITNINATETFHTSQRRLIETLWAIYREKSFHVYSSESIWVSFQFFFSNFQPNFIQIVAVKYDVPVY